MIDAVLIIVQLIFLEGVLSIDNAAVLGAMVAVLPRNKPIPWPPFLSFLSAPLGRVLGNQQSAALKVGLLGAYLGRGLMLVMASFVIGNPWLRALGALYLLHLAAAHLSTPSPSSDDSDADSHPSHSRRRTFWVVVFHVELADLAFSIDNVVAAVALSREIWVVMTGVALGIITMRFAAQIFTRLIARHPILEATAYLLVLNISLELLTEELAEFRGWEVHFDHWHKFLVSAMTIVLSLGWAYSPELRWLLFPVVWVGKYLLIAVDTLFRIGIWPFAKACQLAMLPFQRPGKAGH